MTRIKLKEYQDSYAEAMQKYELQRGIEGSEARHVSTQQFYRDLFVQNEKLKEDIDVLQEQKDNIYEKVCDMYDRKDEARDKFLAMDEHIKQKDKELKDIDSQLQTARQKYEPYTAQEELNLIHSIFPMMKEQLRIAELCRKIGLAMESIKLLLDGKTLIVKTFSFFSPEHNQKFTANDVKLKIEKETDKLRLNLNGKDILEWFRERFKEKFHVGKKLEIDKNKGIRM